MKHQRCAERGVFSHPVGSLAFSTFFQIVAFFQKRPEIDLTVYLGPISVPYMPQITLQQISFLWNYA